MRNRRKMLLLLAKKKSSGGSIWQQITGSPPLTLLNAKNNIFGKIKQFGKLVPIPATVNTAITQYGKCVQDGADIMCNNGALKYGETGKNLFDIPASVEKGYITFTKDSDGYVTASPSNADSRSWGKDNAQYLVNLAPGKYKFVIKLKTPSASQYSGWEIYNPAGVKIAGSSGGKFRADEVAAFTASESGDYYIMAKLHSSASRFMVVKDGADTSNYEPYTEGIYTDGTPEVLTVLGEESETLSGDVVTFEANKAMTVTEGKIGIEAEQDLHGYNSPWPAGGGVNLLDPAKCSAVGPSGTYGLTVTHDQATAIWTISGTPTSQNASLAFNFCTYSDLSLSGKGYQVQAFPISGTPIKNFYGFRNEAENKIAIIIDTVANPTVNMTFKVSVAATAQTAWSPYSNICPISGWTGANVYHSGADASDATTYSITFPAAAGTVYGGTLDVTNGVLTVDRAMVVYDGSEDETWNLSSAWGKTNTAVFYSTAISGAYYPDWTDYRGMMTNLFLNATRNYIYNNDVECCGFSGMVVTSPSPTIRVLKTRANDVASFRSFLNSNNLQFCYELATPQTYQLTPTQIQTLVGVNNIWSDTGSIESLKYGTVQTASVVNLFSTLDGSVRDEVDVVSGIVTRRTEAVYENGEIVVKALAEPVTEQTTAYPQLANGKYVNANVEAEVSDISVVFTRGQSYTPTPYTPISYMCNNGELKVDSNDDIYAYGTPEELKVSASGIADQIASVVNLLAINNDYRDAQDIISGLLTHKVGIKVLTGDNTKDGTWGTSSGTSNLYTLTIADSSTDNTFLPISTHFVGVLGSIEYASIQDGQFKHGSNSNTYFFKDVSSEDVTAFKNYLATQYAAGTPVIVFYPLATEVEESVIPQALTTVEGTNTVSVVSNVDPVELDISYKAVRT